MNEKIQNRLVSLFILLFLLLQGYAAFGYYGRLWPFLDYPMYSYSKHIGDSIDNYLLYGIQSDSTQVAILPEDLGLNFWKFLWGPVRAIRFNDNKEIQKYVSLYQSKRNYKLFGLQLMNNPLILTEEGVVPLPSPEVVNTVNVKEFTDL